jgi:hypothetical protein
VVCSMQPQELKDDEHTDGPPRPSALPPRTIILLWLKLQISLISTLCSPVLLSSLATRKPSRGLSGRAPRPPWRSLDRERRMSATKKVRFYRVFHSSVRRFLPIIPCHLVSKDEDRPNDPLSLSTQQSRLIRQTWVSAAGNIGGSSDGKTQTSSRPKYRNRRGRAGAARPDSTNTNITSASTVSSTVTTDKSTWMFFKHLKNIEKVSKTVDERMQKRKVQKEWSTKVISETARLRDGEGGGLVKVNMNTNMHTSERPPSNDNADIVAPHVDAFDDDDNDLLGLGTPQSDDRDPESMEEVVPTSQSQERYLSPLGASCAPTNGSTATT